MGNGKKSKPFSPLKKNEKFGAGKVKSLLAPIRSITQYFGELFIFDFEHAMTIFITLGHLHGSYLQKNRILQILLQYFQK